MKTKNDGQANSCSAHDPVFTLWNERIVTGMTLTKLSYATCFPARMPRSL